jgi:hypothetical protein
MSQTSHAPVVALRNTMSLVPSALKSPEPATYHVNPTVPRLAALVMLLSLMS